MTLRAQQVFTPGSYPSHTYIERENNKFEATLRDAIDTPGQIVSLIGPSKSGKTVLVERVVGRQELITVTGAGIESPEDIWNGVLDWMNVPSSQEKSHSTSGKVAAEAKAGGSIKLPLVGGVESEAKGGIEAGHERGKSSSFQRAGLTQVVHEIADSDYVVLVDDFHYMKRDVQAEAAKSLKEAVRLGIKVCTASVVHRGDDLVRANPELRGRVFAIDLKYWPKTDLAKIAEQGFSHLNASIDDKTIDTLALEAAGSPQLMQLLCLNVCFVLDLREKKALTHKHFALSIDQIHTVLERASAANDFRSLVDVLDSGPKTRGTERKVYEFRDGSKGDVYRVILKAVASDPPQLSFNYESLTQRVAKVCTGDVPVGSSVTGTCLHLARLAHDKFPSERAIDWDEQKLVLDIPDPYLLFYLRWSGRLSEPEE